jgi:hypothetical protein
MHEALPAHEFTFQSTSVAELSHVDLRRYRAEFQLDPTGVRVAVSEYPMPSGTSK